MTNFLDKRFNKLKQIMNMNISENNNTIDNFQNLLGLNDQNQGEFRIKIEKKNRNILLKIKYISNNIFDLTQNNISELPLDINIFISEFIPSYIEFEFEITYGDIYPFTPPVWSIVSCDDRLSNVQNMIHYYNYIVKSHNVNNSYDWSPAVDIDKDILYFISKIGNGNFELLKNCF